MTQHQLPAKILVGARDRDLKLLLTLCLEDSECVVEAVERPEDLVSRAVSGDASFILLSDDLYKTGVQDTLRQLRAFEKTRYTPVLILCSKPIRPELRSLLRAGIDLTLTWPLSEAELLRSIETLSQSNQLVSVE